MFRGASRSVVSQTAQALKLVRSDRDLQARTLDEDERLWSGLAAVTLRRADNLSWPASLRPGDLVSFVYEGAAPETDAGSHPSLWWHAGGGRWRLRATAKPPMYHRQTVLPP